ncbi:MAG: hypothetical protein JW940_20295 [Polyangiaceae bacterium]|nr:hypothetical protein [Polyangiaceae bacterium]
MDRPPPSARQIPALAALASLLVCVPGPSYAQDVPDAPEAQPPAAAPPGDETTPAEATASSASAPEQEPPPAAAVAAAPSATTKAPPPATANGTDEAPVSALTEEEAARSWFARPALRLAVGKGDRQWAITFFGFIEADFIHDTTRSYADSIGGSLVARKETYAGQVGRTQFSMRNTRIGLSFESPMIGGVKPTAVFQGDFFGNQPGHPPDIAESAYFDSPTFRARHAYFKLENDYVDVLVGQTYDLFGWQNYFFPCSAEFLGLPNQVFHRTTQLRLSHTFDLGSFSVDLAAAALRPVQRDSQFPDGNAGVRFSVDSWKGISTPGNVGTAAFPLSIGVSAVARQFRVNAFTPPPAQRSNRADGWGLALDGLIPVIPAESADDRGNRLTLVGGFVTGTGIADLITAGGGATFPTLPNPALANPPPIYSPDIDDGLVTFDTVGVLHTIDWQAFRVGLQYYVPPTGRVFVSLNYTQAYSKNIPALFPRGGAEIELLTRVAERSHYADANLFWDATPAVRFGGSFQYTTVEYIDRQKPRNLRGMGQAIYVF